VYSKLRHHVVNVKVHANWWIRDRFPDRKVTRHVQGVDLVLPWSHRLPDYAQTDGPYGQNLVHFARELAAADGAPVTVLDVGANVGDSAAQIVAACDARVLCVEADPYYLEFLHLNVDGLPQVTVVEGLLTLDGTEKATTAVRSGGTTHFVEGSADEAMGSISMTELRSSQPDFEQLRLVKSDTDGYDVVLVPALARSWGGNPALFFEYDHFFSREVGNDPLQVWSDLAELGYTDVAVWDNGGILLGRIAVSEIAARTAPLDEKVGARSHMYWDVAVVHGDDKAGLVALEKIAPSSKPL
jgi:FkbM family methyltransferase